VSIIFIFLMFLIIDAYSTSWFNLPSNETYDFKQVYYDGYLHMSFNWFLFHLLNGLDHQCLQYKLFNLASKETYDLYSVYDEDYFFIIYTYSTS
jgi:hypothetical protein